MKSGIFLYFALILIVFGCQSPSVQSDSDAIIPSDLRCEYRENPIGIDAHTPRLSWISESGQRGQVQTAYRIIVSSSVDKLVSDEGDLWDSENVSSDQSAHIPYDGKSLAAGIQVFWKVKLWDKEGEESPWSEAASWVMGLLTQDNWQAQWIKDPSAENGIGKTGLPIFRRSFSVDKPIKRVVVHASGLGQYELFVNGSKTGDHFLDPAWSTYEKTVYYNTFDITSSVEQGENVLGVMLGKGFYNTLGDRRIHGVNANNPLKLILQAQIDYEDGSSEKILSNNSWKVTDGPITHSGILGGSDYDARKLPNGWTEPGYNDSRWRNAELTKGPGGNLRASISPPMKVMEVFEPVIIDEPEPGVFVYDFGQNASCTPKLIISGKSGQVVQITPAEQRFGNSPQSNDGKGRVNQAGIGKPNYWEYTLKGGDVEEWMPQFTYTGFQYLEVRGAVPEGFPNPKGLPVVESLVSCHVWIDTETRGHFSCSNPLINDISQMIEWSVQSNMAHVLTDCPQREKLGWLEQSYLMEPSIGCSYDILNFYRKIAGDIRDSRGSDGAIYTVAPNFPGWTGVGFGYTPEWGAAGVVVPWQVYKRYGDLTILKENYEMMKGFVDYMHETSNDLIPIAGLGDWCDYGHGHKGWYSRYTPFELSAMATFYLCTDIVSKTAAIIEISDDQKKYEKLAEKIKAKFNESYFNGKDNYTNFGSPQTANSMAIVTGMVPGESEKMVLGKIVQDIKERDNQQTSGDVGFTYLVQALAGCDRHDVLNDMINERHVGSYGFFVDHGWTSLPENWDSNTEVSMNHLMLGHIQQWLYSDLAGIQSDPDEIAYKKLILYPKLVKGLTAAQGSCKSIYGTIISDWEIRDDQFRWNITVPVNSSAFVYIPATRKKEIAESGVPATKAKGVRFIEINEKGAIFEIGSGAYDFSSTGFEDFIIHSTIYPLTKINTPSEDILASDPVTLESDLEGATIYYTLDGSEPDEFSLEYTGPFTLDKTSTVKARAYMEGLKPGYVKSKFISVYNPELNGVNYEYFLGKWEVLPDFNALSPENSGTVYSIKLSHIQTRESNFGIRFQGFIEIPKEGEYIFYLNSDDGSRFFIDGNQIVDNDGLHGVLEKSGKVKLTAGKHAIRVDYMQGGDGMEIGISWEGPGFGKQRLGAYSLFRK